MKKIIGMLFLGITIFTLSACSNDKKITSDDISDIHIGMNEKEISKILGKPTKKLR